MGPSLVSHSRSILLTMTTNPRQAIVVAYHGTSAEAAEAVKQDGFHMSQNSYDWLGDGVYFFQDAPHRAWEWANSHHPDGPAVIRAELDLSYCMDLLDTAWNSVLADTHDAYIQLLKESGRIPPVQAGGAHPLDREVINYALGVLTLNGVEISCVRGAFVEGRPVYPDSALYDRTHVQISVRDVSTCVRRVWLESSIQSTR